MYNKVIIIIIIIIIIITIIIIIKLPTKVQITWQRMSIGYLKPLVNNYPAKSRGISPDQLADEAVG